MKDLPLLFEDGDGMGFGWMILGYFFVFFDLNFGKVNIFPDWIGFILLFIGASKLVKMIGNPSFFILKKTYFLLIVLSIIDWLNKCPLLNGVNNNTETIQGRIFSLIFIIAFFSLSVYTFFHLFKGIEFEAKKINALDLASQANSVLKQVIVFQIMNGLFYLISVFFSDGQSLTFSFDGIFIFLFIIILILFIYIYAKVLSLLNRTNLLFSTQFKKMI